MSYSKYVPDIIVLYLILFCAALIITAILRVIAYHNAVISFVHSRWHYYFDFTRFSVEDFYKVVRAAIDERSISEVHIRDITFREEPFIF